MEPLMTIPVTTMPFLVLLNFVTLWSLDKRVRRFDQVIAKYEQREHNKLERDTWEALTLLRSGKTEEAKAVANKILDA